MIARRDTNDDIRRQAQRQGMLTLREVGLFHVLDGVTSLDEILRVVV